MPWHGLIFLPRSLETLAWIIWSWQCCRLLVGNIANGIASKNFFSFLTELGNFRQKFFGGNAIGNVAKQKSAALPRADDLGQCKHVWADYHPIIPNKQRVEGRSLLDMTKRHLPLYQGKYPKISVFISLLLLPSINQIVNGERRQIT